MSNLHRAKAQHTFRHGVRADRGDRPFTALLGSSATESQPASTLHRYIVFEIKARPFRPADLGQLNFYVTTVERTLRTDRDSPTICVLLVPEKNRMVVEYSLAGIGTPMTVANYTYSELRAEVRSQLPPADELAHLVDGTLD